jgi:phosphatidylserine decarboxylase
MQTLLFSESPVLAGVVLLFIFTSWYCKRSGLLFLSILTLGILMFFYRYSPHEERYLDTDVISPANGTITNIVEKRDSANGDYYVISIFLSVLNRHTQVYPVNGKVTQTVYDRTGKFNIVKDMYKSRFNEKVIHSIQSNLGADITVNQIAGFLPRSISYSNQTNVLAGEYLGIIRFGSRVDLILPRTFQNSQKETYILELSAKVNQVLDIGTKVGKYSRQ